MYCQNCTIRMYWPFGHKLKFCSQRCQRAAYKKRWRADNADKHRVHKVVELAVRQGRLKTPEYCSKCGEKGLKLYAHHNNYNKALKVTWLCGLCHKHWHLYNKSIEIKTQLCHSPCGEVNSFVRFSQQIGVRFPPPIQLPPIKFSCLKIVFRRHPC